MDSNKKKRITSIDALRAVTLLGILLVHTRSGFGFNFQGDHSIIDTLVNSVIYITLVHKCNLIFSALFGVSFYLILRNPHNTSGKFVWRCFLLMIIGLFNKLFYTYDALMWYGLWGMCLVAIRQLRNAHIFLLFIFLTFFSIFLRSFSLGDFLFGISESDRYALDSIWDMIFYPYAVVDYLRIVFNYGIFNTLSFFLLGYWIARVGIIERLDSIVTNKVVIFLWSFSAFSYFLLFFDHSEHSEHSHFLRLLNNYAMAFSYSATLVYVYYHYGAFNKFLHYLEPYGKLGLTNYSIMGIVGVILMSDFGLGLYKINVSISLIVLLLFYLIQVLFSIIWLNYFRYGPMEYLWRVATERKMIEIKKESSSSQRQSRH